MSTQYNESELARAVINTIIAEANLTEISFARRLRGVMGASTINRMLKTGQDLSLFHLHALVGAAARIAHMSPTRLLMAIRSSFTPALIPETELCIARCLSAATPELSRIMSDITTAEASSKQVIMFCRRFPIFLMEDEVAEQVVKYLTTRYASDPRAARSNLQRTMADRREDFMNLSNNQTLRRILIMPMSGLLCMTSIAPPYSGCRKEQIEASLNSILHDAVLDRGVELVILNDLVNPQARDWIGRHASFRSVAIFDSRLLIKRRHGTLACRVIQAADGIEAAAIVQHHHADLISGMNFACHGLSKIEVADFLAKFMISAGYRVHGRWKWN